MRKKGKIVSIVLSVVMLMQIFAIRSFAAQAPTNVHWAKDGDLDKFSDTELVFNLVDGYDLYKMTLYKNKVEIYSYFAGCGSDDGIFYEDMIEALEYAGAGSYTATVGVVKESYDEWYMMEDEVLTVLATSEMSDVLVWDGETRKEEVLDEKTTTEVPTAPTTETTQTTTNSNTKNLPEGDKTLRDFPQIVRINDIRNNDMFEIVEEYTVPQKIVQLYDSRIEFASNIIAALPIKEMSYTYNIFDKSYETTYYDGLNVFDIRDMQFSSIGYTEELNKLRVFEKDSKTGNIKL